jgi:diaminohydroxyphosphoribosylaminopyrimidine deaminase/5-amino-6-(5-phosphoribosylamino)uracil reductase
MSPEQAMRRALALARRASGRTHPNPPVGAVVVRGDRILGRGFTHPPGGPHAEVVAIEDARRRHGPAALRGATLAVTLEPCCTAGRTPPCTEAVIASGVARVWVGQRDPHPAVDGRGLRRLRAAGLAVRAGVLEDDCRAQHRGFVSVVERGRPWVALKLAATLDGRIATARGESRWVTGEAARALVHRLRARVDAVAVGSSSARRDDPELTARRGARVLHRPVRVVFDSALSLPLASRLVRARDPERTLVVGTAGAPAARRRSLARAGVRVLLAPRRGGRVDLRRALERLAGEGITEMLVEGGGELAGALLREGLIDEVHWFVAPSFFGADGRPALGPLGVGGAAERFALAPGSVRVRRVGEDVYIHGRPSPRGPARARRGRARGSRRRPG